MILSVSGPVGCKGKRVSRAERVLDPDRSALSRFGCELRRWRKVRGLSQDRLGSLVHVSGDLVYRVELAERRPARDLAERCDQVLETGGALVQLWDAAGAEAAARSADPRVTDTGNVGNGCATGETTGSGGQPRLPGSQTDAMLDLIDDMNRRELLRILAMTGTMLAISAENDTDWDRLDYVGGQGGRVDSQAVEDYAALTTHLWRVFVLARTKHVVFPLVRDQLDVLTSSLGRASGTAMYRRLCEVTASLFQLAGEILFDANQYTDAAQCYTLAATASKEANMPDLWACALTRHAFIGVFERRFERSAALLELAAVLAQRGDASLATRHWVAIVQAQALAGLGQLDACQRALDVAGQVDDLSGDFQNGGWLRFDGSRLPEERGACYVQLQRPDLAESALTDALRLNLSARRRGSVLTDLAALGAQRRDPDQIVSYGDAALELISQTGSGVIARKLAGLQPHLAPFLRDARIRDLSTRIGALGVTAPAGQS
jgi:tetratricopeptide (TPR) repeat protein/transcriptional regulator with XRE-family HTH domain